MSMNKNYTMLLSNTVIFAIGNIGAKLISFLLVPLYTNVLSTAEYGITELVLTSSNLIIPILTISIQDSTLRYGLEKKTDKGEVLKNSVFILLIGTIVMLMLSPIISIYNVLADWYIYFAAITILQMFRTVLSVYLKAINNNKAYAFQSIIYAFLLALFNIIFLVKLKIGISGYFYSMIISLLITTIYIITKGRVIATTINSSFNKTLCKNMCLFSIPMVINSISWWLVNSANRFMIEYYLTPSEVGLYSAAAKIPSLLTVFTGIFLSAWTISSITEYDASQDKKFFSNVFDAFSFMMLLIASGVILIIKPFMSIYVGESFYSAWRYVPFLLVGSVFLAYSYFFGAIYTAAKKNVAIAITTIIGAIFGIILNIFLIPRIGVFGAVITTVLSYFGIALYRAINSRIYFSFEIKYKRVFVALFVVIVQSFLSIFSEYPIITSVPCVLFILYLYKDNIKTTIIILRSKNQIKRQ